jgi:hypothetical protein
VTSSWRLPSLALSVNSVRNISGCFIAVPAIPAMLVWNWRNAMLPPPVKKPSS